MQDKITKEDLQKVEIDKEIKEEPKKNEADDFEFAGNIKEVSQEKELVIKPPKGGWKNECQAELAKTLNAFYYSNNKKFMAQKETLLEQLKKAGEDEAFCRKITGVDPRVRIKSNYQIEE